VNIFKGLIMIQTNGNKKLRKKIISQMSTEDKTYHERPDVKDWYNSRYDDDEIERRKGLLAHGLSGMIHLQLLDGQLWAIVFIPDSGFSHLTNMTARQNLVYHISICFTQDIDTDWKKSALRHLHQLYEKPVRHVFHVEHFTAGLTALIPRDDSVYQEIKDLHAHGYYKFRDIHMSL
jgi:hypothetical protein